MTKHWTGSVFGTVFLKRPSSQKGQNDYIFVFNRQVTQLSIYLMGLIDTSEDVQTTKTTTVKTVTDVFKAKIVIH